MRGKHPVLLCLVILSLAGCSSPAEDTPDAPDAPTVEAPPGPGVEAPDAGSQSQPWRHTLSFTPDGGLAPNASEGSIVLAGGWSTFLGDGRFSEFLSEPVTQTTLLMPEAMDLHLVVQADTVGVADPAFTYAIWAGTTQSMPSNVIGSLPGSVLTPGTATAIDATVDLSGLLPIVMMPGDQVRIIVAINFDGAVDTGGLRLLTGPEMSTVSLTTLGLTSDPLAGASPAAESLSGTLHSLGFTECSSQEGVNYATHQITLDANATYLRIAGTGSSPEGRTDFDLDLLDGQTRIAGGHSPLPDEGILLAGDALEALRGKALTLQASACLGAAVEYQIAVEQGVA